MQPLSAIDALSLLSRKAGVLSEDEEAELLLHLARSGLPQGSEGHVMELAQAGMQKGHAMRIASLQCAAAACACNWRVVEKTLIVTLGRAAFAGEGTVSSAAAEQLFCAGIALLGECLRAVKEGLGSLHAAPPPLAIALLDCASMALRRNLCTKNDACQDQAEAHTAAMLKRLLELIGSPPSEQGGAHNGTAVATHDLADSGLAQAQYALCSSLMACCTAEDARSERSFLLINALWRTLIRLATAAPLRDIVVASFAVCSTTSDPEFPEQRKGIQSLALDLLHCMLPPLCRDVQKAAQYGDLAWLKLAEFRIVQLRMFSKSYAGLLVSVAMRESATSQPSVASTLARGLAQLFSIIPPTPLLRTTNQGFLHLEEWRRLATSLDVILSCILEADWSEGGFTATARMWPLLAALGVGCPSAAPSRSTRESADVDAVEVAAGSSLLLLSALRLSCKLKSASYSSQRAAASLLLPAWLSSLPSAHTVLQRPHPISSSPSTLLVISVSLAAAYIECARPASCSLLCSLLTASCSPHAITRLVANDLYHSFTSMLNPTAASLHFTFVLAVSRSLSADTRASWVRLSLIELLARVLPRVSEDAQSGALRDLQAELLSIAARPSTWHGSSLSSAVLLLALLTPALRHSKRGVSNTYVDSNLPIDSLAVHGSDLLPVLKSLVQAMQTAQHGKHKVEPELVSAICGVLSILDHVQVPLPTELQTEMSSTLLASLGTDQSINGTTLAALAHCTWSLSLPEVTFIADKLAGVLDLVERNSSQLGDQGPHKLNTNSFLLGCCEFLWAAAEIGDIRSDEDSMHSLIIILFRLFDATDATVKAGTTREAAILCYEVRCVLIWFLTHATKERIEQIEMSSVFIKAKPTILRILELQDEMNASDTSTLLSTEQALVDATASQASSREGHASKEQLQKSDSKVSFISDSISSDKRQKYHHNLTHKSVAQAVKWIELGVITLLESARQKDSNESPFLNEETRGLLQSHARQLENLSQSI